MEAIIDGYNFAELEVEKYWSLPKTKDPHIEIKNLIFSGDYIAAEKVDGHFYMLIKDMSGNYIFRGRSKNVNKIYVDKSNFIPHITEEFEYLPNGTVLIGEAYLPKYPGSKNVTTIMGCLLEKSLKRQEIEDKKIHFYIFDCLAFNGQNIMNKSIIERISYIENLQDDFYYHRNRPMRYSSIAEFYEGQELWDYIGEVLSAGGEGVVLQSKSGAYEPGKRKAWKTVKVKKEINNELDLFFTGKYKPSTVEYTGKEIKTWTYWMHQRTGEKLEGYLYDDFAAGEPILPITKGYFYGWAGSVQLGAIDEEGNIVEVAWISNLTEDVKKKVITGELDFQVVKVTAMEIDSESHNLRHAKIVEYRDDKDWKDCSIDQLYK